MRRFATAPTPSTACTCDRRTGSQVPLSAFTHYETKNTALAVNHQGQFPAVTISFNLDRGRRAGRRRPRNRSGRAADGPSRRYSSDVSREPRRPFSLRLPTQPWLILAALVTVYIVLGMLYESYIHPITILSTLPSAGVGALLALRRFAHGLERDRPDRNHSADRHRQEKRHHDDRFRGGSRAHGRKDARGIDLSGLPAAIPSDHDDHDGRAVRRPAAGAG